MLLNIYFFPVAFASRKKSIEVKKKLYGGCKRPLCYSRDYLKQSASREPHDWPKLKPMICLQKREIKPL